MRAAPRRHRSRLLWVALLLAPLTAACADDDDSPPTAARPATEYPASVEPQPSPGCGRSAATGGVRRERRTIEAAGQQRWFLLSTPTEHDGRTPLPLVVEFHGLAQGAENAAATGLLDELGEQAGFVSVFPQGTGSPVRWNERLDDPANADFAFVDTMLETLGRDLCVDQARTYATGLSYGAIMSSAMACTRAHRFAAVAPVAGVQRPQACSPSRPVPVLSFHGTADPILLFNGGLGDLRAALSGQPLSPPDKPIDLHGEGYPANLAAWAKANGCGAATDERRSDHVLERVYECPREAEVRFLIVEGGGHSWPGSTSHRAIASIVGPTTDELRATEELWSFFRRHAIATAQRR